MIPSLTIAGGSAAALIALMLLFRAEDARGERLVLSSVRDRLDRLVSAISTRVSHITFHLGGGAIRATFHYLLHKLLNILLGVLSRMASYLERLQLRNKRIARVIRENGSRTHLDEIASHKEETSLSEEEKRKRRLQ